jgi:tRNA(fMet)-specific endonuclease VapC
MLRYMLDTNICIYLSGHYPQKLLERFNRFDSQICLSTITLAELYFGIEKSERRSQNLDALNHFVGRLTILPFSEKAASHYGEVRVDLQKSGRLIGPHDMLIASHARSEGLALVTNNEHEFRRVPGLLVENWT